MDAPLKDQILESFFTSSAALRCSRAREARDESQPDRIGSANHDDGDPPSHVLRRLGWGPDVATITLTLSWTSCGEPRVEAELLETSPAERERSSSQHLASPERMSKTDNVTLRRCPRRVKRCDCRSPCELVQRGIRSPGCRGQVSASSKLSEA